MESRDFACFAFSMCLIILLWILSTVQCVTLGKYSYPKCTVFNFTNYCSWYKWSVLKMISDMTRILSILLRFDTFIVFFWPISIVRMLPKGHILHLLHFKLTRRSYLVSFYSLNPFLRKNLIMFEFGFSNWPC